MNTETPRIVAVIDIGKTNAKLALVDAAERAEIAVRSMPNEVRTDGLYPHFDVEGLWAFLLEALTELNAERRIEAVTATTHGASCALLGAGGRLAMPVLDYEHDGPAALAAEYDALRPPFAETGTPRMPNGLSIGAQIHWQARRFPEAFATVETIVTYPQYWTGRLSGVASAEVTSLSCHGDLWNVAASDYSQMVDRLGWRRLFAPIRKAGDRLGPILPEIAAATGLAPDTPVFCGIHDSNASLAPHLLARRQPFSVVSTGTWIAAMSLGGAATSLDPERGAMLNVNAFGDPVPSVRFMGGREHALLTGGLAEGWSEIDVAEALTRPLLIMPTLLRSSGPYPKDESAWLGAEGASDGARRVAAGFYLAMMTAVSLELMGAAGPTVVEGPLAGEPLYLRMLAAALGRGVAADDGASTGASIGAALLTSPNALVDICGCETVENADPHWTAYARVWRAEAAKRATEPRSAVDRG